MRKTQKRRRGFVLILVLVVVAIATLACFTFMRSMLNAKDDSQISIRRFQARMCAESGLQAVRLFVAQPRQVRLDMGGDWENDMFYARNVIPNAAASQRGNFTLIAPSLGSSGGYEGIRFGLQNESAKLNLNTLAQLDAMASSGDLGAAAGGGDDASGDALSSLASSMTSSVSSDLSSQMLMALPGMTIEVADAILDFIDADDEMREYGAEFDDYYGTLQTPYRPPNGPLTSIEQLLLVRGVTPQLLFGFDQDRNGVLDDQEMQQMNMVAPMGTGESIEGVPPPLGWAAYMTLHSMEKNVTRNGEVRININSDDLETLYADLTSVLGDENLASFMIAFRHFGKAGGDGSSPLVTLASMAAEESDPGGALGSQIDALGALAGGGQNANQQTQPWSSDLLAGIDMTQSGSVKFNQVLDVFGATVTIQQGNNQIVYESPLMGTPGELALLTPLLMDNLTTVDADAIPGRVNIMQCPAEVMRGIPGLADEIVDQILQAREDGSESETRFYETWLAVEGYLTIDQMRAILPLVTCGGDVYKAQIVGYLEGNAAGSSRIEAIVSGAGEVPMIQFYRRLTHLGRGADIATLGQRFDATFAGAGM